jgi:ATP-dependent helicase/nuclease subunit A
LPIWLSWVDRLTPSELLQRVLAEAAYVYEIQGTRHRQARENLKKLGAMVRRFQNRGYATLSRVAEHLEQLAVGDESNAVIDAEDAVSLMTVHAAKGLEFPIVFIVNMNRGTGTGRPPIRVAGDAQGEAAVAIADYQSEADEDSAARDREETKRLLYVALTRARDRLYLSSSLSAGVIRPTRGSLGEVLPGFVRDLFSQANATEDGVLRIKSWVLRP